MTGVGQIKILQLSALLLFIFAFSQIRAETDGNRLALVIGNAAYPKAALSNPKNDARLIAEALKSLGFSIHGGVRTDLTQHQMKEAVQSFSKALKQLDDPIAIVFYSGHGMEVGGNNYLLPVNFNVKELTDNLKDKAISLNLVLWQLSSSDPANYMVFIDACRNNPYDNAKNSGEGLYDIAATRGGLISFAAEPGHIALESQGSYSYYTQALAEEIVKPNITVVDMLRTVREKVRDITNGDQFPVVRDATVGGKIVLTQVKDPPPRVIGAW